MVISYYEKTALITLMTNDRNANDLLKNSKKT